MSNVEHWLDSQLDRARKIDQFKGKIDRFKGKIDRFKDKIDRFKDKTDRFKGETDQWKQAERLGDRAKSSVESFGLSRQVEQDVPAKSDRSGG